MQAIDPSFMKTELKVEKTEVKTAMAHSVFSKDKNKDDQKGIESRSSGTNNSRKQGSRATRDSDVFFTLNERDTKGHTKKKLGGASVTTSESFKARNSQYNNQGTKTSKNQN